MSRVVTREAIVLAARDWIQTPYQHQASQKYAGCDCLGLVRGIWRELYGAEPLPVPNYTPDWAEISQTETLLEAARTILNPIALETARSGDALLFRMEPAAPVKHIAILSGENTIIHAYWGRAVVETRLVPFWNRRRAFAFSFPEPPATQKP